MTVIVQIYTNTQDIMGEPCRPGKALNEYKRCRCMSSCGSVEDKYWIYSKGAINGLHLIRELYDDDVLHVGNRRWFLTETTYETTRHYYLVPQHPYPKKKSWSEIVSHGK